MTSSGLLRELFWSVPFWTALGVAILAGASGVSHAAEAPTGAEVLQQLRSFANMGSVLYVAAHPDDENTQAIAYLARGRGYRARKSCSPRAGWTAGSNTSPARRTSGTRRLPRKP